MSGHADDLTRRDFIRVTTACVGGFIATALGLPAVAYALSPSLRRNKVSSWVDLGPLEDYTLDLPALFQFTRVTENGWEKTGVAYGVFVLRSAGGVRVLSNICTHLACRVSWHPDIQQYVSPCHDGHFDIAGNVVSGPPPRPLDEFKTRVEGGRLYIQLPPFQRTS